MVSLFSKHKNQHRVRNDGQGLRITSSVQMCLVLNLAFTFFSSLKPMSDLITGTWWGGEEIIHLECKHGCFLPLVVPGFPETTNAYQWCSWLWSVLRRQTKRKGGGLFASKVGPGFLFLFCFLKSHPVTFTCRKKQHPSISLCAIVVLGIPS